MEKEKKLLFVDGLSLGIFIILGAFFFFICSAQFSYAVEIPTSNFSQGDAVSCINDSWQVIKNMQGQDFKILRVNDTLKAGIDYYNSQIILKEKRRSYDFAKVENYCKEVESIYKNAINARDQINAFLIFYNSSVLPNMNVSTVDAIIAEINLEFESERYEKIPDLIDKAYTELGDVRASYTALNVFYTITTRGLKIFFINNWLIILVFIAIIIILFLIYRVKIAKWILQRHLRNLEVRRNVLRSLVMQTQRDYFQYGRIAEGDYNIKTKKFAELIRDIDRQIPLVKEQIIKLRVRKFGKEEPAKLGHWEFEEETERNNARDKEIIKKVRKVEKIKPKKPSKNRRKNKRNKRNKR